MTGEIIEMCQDCGHVIDPVTVTAPWGTGYLITLCQRDECIADRWIVASRARWEAEALRAEAAYRVQVWFPVVTRPESVLRVTGV